MPVPAGLMVGRTDAVAPVPGPQRRGRDAEPAGYRPRSERDPPVTLPQVVVHGTPELLAAAVAARLVTRLVEVQAARGHASVVLTGGGIGIALLRDLDATPAAGAVE